MWRWNWCQSGRQYAWLVLALRRARDQLKLLEQGRWEATSRWQLASARLACDLAFGRPCTHPTTTCDVDGSSGKHDSRWRRAVQGGMQAAHYLAAVYTPRLLVDVNTRGADDPITPAHCCGDRRARWPLAAPWSVITSHHETCRQHGRTLHSSIGLGLEARGGQCIDEEIYT